MKILHTADWHLCDRLGKLDRTQDLQTRVQKVAALVDELHVDLVLIAGDLFSDKASQAEIATAFDTIRRVFASFFQRGGSIVAITGNHDDDLKLELVRQGLMLAAPAPTGGVFQRGRLYLQNGITFGRFVDVRDEVVQLVLIPYPRPARFELNPAYRTREEEHRELQTRLTDWLQKTRSRPDYDMTLPTVLMAHLHVRGSNLNHNLFRMTDAEDILVDLADLSAGWAYVALGHIHQPMQVGGSETIRYPGPLDRLDFGEREDDRGVIIFDLERTGVRGVPTWHHLPPTPMHRISVTDPDQELATLTETYPDHESAIVQIEVHQPASCVLTRHQITLALRKIFPRCHMLTWIRQHDASTADQDSDQTDNRLSVSINRETRGFGETVRQYLQQKLEQHPARTEILALAERFLQSSQKESR